ncbi:MAG: dienelactone hydrolase family protein [Proteobacteria bacterium]|nr:dienelactone hydrolase family protein [Pseudomonadota bacterium]
MPDRIDLTASDGHTFGAWKAAPSGAPKGALLVIQEAFGVNAHIREMVDKYAGEGYLALAPQLYDRVERDVDVGYVGEDRERGIACMKAMNFDDAMRDVEAARDAIASGGKIGITGWCWGGSISWLAACRVSGLAASVPCYGGRIPDFKDETPKCPVMFQWGETDASLPLDKVEEVRAAQPGTIHHIYPGAGHGFTCDHRESYHEASAKLAHERSMAFFAEHLA